MKPSYWKGKPSNPKVNTYSFVHYLNTSQDQGPWRTCSCWAHWNSLQSSHAWMGLSCTPGTTKHANDWTLSRLIVIEPLYMPAMGPGSSHTYSIWQKKKLRQEIQKLTQDYSIRSQESQTQIQSDSGVSLESVFLVIQCCPLNIWISVNNLSRPRSVTVYLY